MSTKLVVRKIEEAVVAKEGQEEYKYIKVTFRKMLTGELNPFSGVVEPVLNGERPVTRNFFEGHTDAESRTFQPDPLFSDWEDGFLPIGAQVAGDIRKFDVKPYKIGTGTVFYNTYRTAIIDGETVAERLKSQNHELLKMTAPTVDEDFDEESSDF